MKAVQKSVQKYKTTEIKAKKIGTLTIVGEIQGK
jgi:hypothetical protein